VVGDCLFVVVVFVQKKRKKKKKISQLGTGSPVRGSGNFRPLEIEMNTSASTVLRMCAERLRLGPAVGAPICRFVVGDKRVFAHRRSPLESFALCEAIQRGNSVAERLVGPNECTSVRVHNQPPVP
jgi:hypothetical protein